MALSTTEVLLILLGSVLGVVSLIAGAFQLWKRRQEDENDLTQPLKDGETRGKKQDPVVQMLYKQVTALQYNHDKQNPEHVRLLQQDLVNRKIFEQLNNQQKHINEVITSQDKILRDQLQKIDVIERQEDCLIEKIDEFMKETITETARAMQNETEYHHYKQRKLQQTLLAQSAERAAGMIDSNGVESQLNELKLMFQKSQEERQGLVATLTQASSDLKRQTQLQTWALDQVATDANIPPQSPQVESPASSPGAPPVHVSSVILKHPTTTQQYPAVTVNKVKPHPPMPPKGGVTSPYPIHLSGRDEEEGSPQQRVRAVDISQGLPTYANSSQSTMQTPLSLPPPALKKKRARQEKEAAAAERRDTKATVDTSNLNTDEWWNGVGQGGPLRSQAAFEEKQLAAERTLQRISGGGGPNAAGGADDDENSHTVSLPSPPRKASFLGLSSSQKQHPSEARTLFSHDSPLGPTFTETAGDSDDDLTFAAPAGQHSFKPGPPPLDV